MKYPLIRIAHRGASKDYPENTLLAFRKAIAQGVDFLEMDLHLTQDREIVVIHDETLERTTSGQGFVWEKTLAELKQLDAGGGESIPALLEVIELVRPTSVNLCLELKYEFERFYSQKYLEEGLATAEAVIALLAQTNFLERAVLTSYSPTILEHVKKIEARYPLVLDPHPQDGTLKPRQVIDQVLTSHANIAAYYYPHCNTELMDVCRMNGISLWAWDVDDEDELFRLVEMGVHGIMTNCPEKLNRVLEAYYES